MKRPARSFIFILLAISLLTVSAFADMGPKSQLVVRVKHAPDELYYLDLLAEGDAADLHDYASEERAELDPALLESLISAIPEGWHGCISQGVKGAPIFGQLTPQEPGVHPFSYFGVPWTYRILMVTESGEVYLSDVQERTVLQSSVTLNWNRQSLSSPPVWAGYLLQFAATFFPTLILEGLLLILFGLSKSRRNWLSFLLVNLLTQGALALWCSMTFMKSGVSIMFLILFIPAELIILLVETLLYRRCLVHPNPNRVRIYAIFANLCSALLGWVLAEPVWRFVVSIC